MSSEGIGAMEKPTTVSRQNQGQFKNNGGSIDRRNDFPPNRNGRQRRGKTKPQEAPVATGRTSQKWTKYSNDNKRPRQRGYPNDRRREEIADEEGLGLEDEPLYDSNCRKGNGNHLLSFQYDRRGVQRRANFSHYRGATRPRYNYKTVRYNKERFLQASYQFVVRDNASGGHQYAEQAINPDALVNWDMVELVRSHTVEEVICSICLRPPMAGKMTKCGHTFCWACILHYLSTDESERQGCPLCHQRISSDELKSVHHMPVPRCKEGDVIEMKLMRKNKGSVYVCPRAQWKDMEGNPVNIHDGVATAYNKVLVASNEQIYSDVIELEKTALAIQLAEAIDYERGYIVMAQDLLQKREAILKERIRSTSCSSSTATTEDEQPEATPSEVVSTSLAPDQSFDGTQINTTYADAFEDEVNNPEPDRFRLDSVGEETIPFETLHEDEYQAESSMGDTEAASEESAVGQDFLDKFEATGLHAQAHCSIELPESTMSAVEAHCSIELPDSTMSAAEAADHLELPQAPQAKRANYSKDVYYFYQASTGQHIYLDALNARCLTEEYGSLEDSPDTIVGTVVAIDRAFMDEDMRKRFRYLNHIPLTCEIQSVEVRLKSPTLSKETLKSLKEKFDQRKKERQHKAKIDKANAKRYEAQQRKTSQAYYNSYTIVKSDQFAPSSSPDTGMEGAASQGSPSVGEMSTSPPEDDNGTKSFAQIIRSGNKSTGGSVAAWPSLASPPSAKPARPVAQSPEEAEDEEGRAPSYADSMFQAWGKVSFKAKTPSKATESECPPPPAPPASGGKKKKKKEGMTMLFSTGMARRI